jgi:dienelactone hydrolase
VPLLVVLETGDAKPWDAWCAERGWRFLAPWTGLAERPIDARIKILETRVAEARRDPQVDPSRIYLAGRGEAAAAVFYVASRAPDLWAAAVAAGGSARPALDTFRVFAANTTLVPVLWLVGDDPDEAAAAKAMQDAGYNLESRPAASATAGDVFAWLAGHRQDAFPAAIDCETGSPLFARCYWIEMTRFDAAERNDAIPSTRIRAGSGATLDLGGFGYERAAPGPGVLVTWLPDKYAGPLKKGDRLVALGGKPLENARAFAHLLDATVEEKPVVVTVERGKQRLRLDTRIVLPRREETVTARVQARYAAETGDLEIVSRTATALRLTLQAPWAAARINWNGTPVEKTASPGCWLLELEKEIPKVRPCP